ncbi:MAG: ATP-binding cassette domain-containing protein [Methylococcaceae bacterium]|nr:ATP-binding cassette domain-containing protein [Methylococcaceae bacterium]
MINVEQLIFEYPNLRALDEVSFHIPQGSITALVGPNGAGKTTLLRCMAALDQPMSGNIRIDGIDVLEHPRECHRIIGYLSDFFGLYDRLTVRQCLPDRLDVLAGTLSRGLRQRVAIAQAIIHSPRVVLLDEPASGLDPEARHELAELFLELQKQGMTLLVSSHILAELEAYSTDMLVLRQGRIIEQVAIKTHSHAQDFKLTLATPVANLAALLQSIDKLIVLKTEHDQSALLQIQGDSLQQHELLKNLLARNLPVCEFAKISNNLQDAYLETIRQRP